MMTPRQPRPQGQVPIKWIYRLTAIRFAAAMIGLETTRIPQSMQFSGLTKDFLFRVGSLCFQPLSSNLAVVMDMNTKDKYRAYLKSPDWQAKKRYKASQTPKRCSICAATEFIHLHHLYYRSTWQATENQDLRWLCGRCHKLAHDLINSGTLKFPKPDNHHSCFILTKVAVKKELGISKVNCFAARSGGLSSDELSGR